MALSRAALASKLSTPFHYVESIGSSNDFARDWLMRGAVTGAAVIADQQTKGRGRLGRNWSTPPGAAIAMSVVLHPPQEWLSRVAMLGALAVCELAEGLGCAQAGIKWPNDAQINGMKVSGILPEAVLDGAGLRGVVLGIGVNVRNDFRGTELAGTATCLEACVDKRLDRAKLTADLLSRVLHWHSRIGSDELFDAWQSRLNMLGQRVEVEGITGIAMAVTADGMLQMLDEAGDLRVLPAGDVLLRGRGNPP